jgi:hypothetical protein
MDVKQFKDRVDAVNKTLEDSEPESIETYNLGGKEFTGYKGQVVLDILNTMFEPNEWRYTIGYPSTLEGKDFAISVSVEFYINNEWCMKGAQFGAGSALGSVGDARKAAVSDGFKKALNLWGIGSKPYRGLLGAPKKVTEPETFLARELKKEIAEVVKGTGLTEIQIKFRIAERIKLRWPVKPNDIEGYVQRDAILSDLKDFLKKMIEEHKTLGG